MGKNTDDNNNNNDNNITALLEVDHTLSLISSIDCQSSNTSKNNQCYDLMILLFNLRMSSYSFVFGQSI